jgi:pyruvate dehydrogenase E2 component (dihydrolipoamide acetyltransferase)
VVPVVKNADQLSLLDIGRTVERLAEEARTARIKLEDLQGSTFTITSLGQKGGLFATPIIHYPEVAILGVHKIVERPIARGGQVVIAPMMNAVIGFDHRAVDGEMAVKFLRRVCELLEKPELLWFHT